MFEEERHAFLVGGRLGADGVPFSDLSTVKAAVEGGARWFDAWMGLSDGYERLAMETVSASQVSVGEWLWLSAMSAHAAQLYWFEDEDEKRFAEARRVELYRRASSSLCPPAIEVMIDAPRELARAGPDPVKKVRAFLRYPTNERDRKWPCVILLGGLDSTKEESRLFEELCLVRGVATCTFDGPGQGEKAHDVPLGARFDTWVSAAVSALLTIESINPDGIGVVGRSLGGTYALQAAGYEPRLKACLAWSPLVSGRSFSRLPAGVRRTFEYACGGVSADVAERVATSLIDSVAEIASIECPTLISHGARDRIVPYEDQVSLNQPSGSVVESVIQPNGGHCCHNIAPTVRPQLADWITLQLKEVANA